MILHELQSRSKEMSFFRSSLDGRSLQFGSSFGSSQIGCAMSASGSAIGCSMPQSGSFVCGAEQTSRPAIGGASKDFLKGRYQPTDISATDWVTISGLPVTKVELFQRPLYVKGQAGTHQGVVLQLSNGRRYLVHKSVDLRTEEVVVEIKPAEKMSAK